MRQFVAKEIPPDETMSLRIGGSATLAVPARHARVSIRVCDVGLQISGCSVKISFVLVLAPHVPRKEAGWWPRPRLGWAGGRGYPSCPSSSPIAAYRRGAGKDPRASHPAPGYINLGL